jgi:hypothetical protein
VVGLLGSADAVRGAASAIERGTAAVVDRSALRIELVARFRLAAAMVEDTARPARQGRYTHAAVQGTDATVGSVAAVEAEVGARLRCARADAALVGNRRATRLHSHLPLLQTKGTVQLPQSSFPPQPSSAIPHAALRLVQVLAGQAHTFASPPPPHVRGALQFPQLSMALQPSEVVPQFFPCAAHDLGVHPH